MTLTKALLPSQSLTARALMVLGGTALIALAAQIKVPMLPVPMTLQTLAILVVGFSMGARLATVTLLAYLAEGFMGLPVFANAGAGPAYFLGPTAGFLAGFVAMAALAGSAADRGVKSVLGMAAVALVASALLYVPGLAWPAATLGKSFDALLSGWMLPFLAGDALKAVIAALIVAGGWKLAR